VQARLNLHCSPVKAEVHAHAASSATADLPGVNGQLHVGSMSADAPAANGWHELAADGLSSAGYNSGGPEAATEPGRSPGMQSHRVTVELTAVEGTEHDDGQVLLQLSAPVADVVYDDDQHTKAGPVPYATQSLPQLQSSAAEGAPSQNGTVEAAAGGAVSRSASPGPRLQTGAAGSGGPSDAATLHEKVLHTASARSMPRSTSRG
jgi:hypothetical protein